MTGKVKVTYPGGTVHDALGFREKFLPEVMMGWSHGPTIKNPNAIMVEDDNGWIHVVNISIVEEV